MRNVRVDKDELLTKLKENRSQHGKIFDEAVEGYRKEALKQLEAQIARIKGGSLAEVSIRVPRPENMTTEYDRAILMLEMSLDDTVEIDEDSFAAYVMDDWHWKRQFLVSNKFYSATAARLSEQV